MADLTKYIIHFSNLTAPTGDWDDSDPVYYTLKLDFNEHGITNPITQVFKLDGNDYIQILTEDVLIDQSTSNVTLRVPKSPNGLFAGRLILL
jgi:hypothetical protein